MKTQQLLQHLEKKVMQHHNLQTLQVWDIVDRLRENEDHHNGLRTIDVRRIEMFWTMDVL
ncbi:hypothetical protein T4B_5383 [Trichinella pseudospiralis]|uniref:Uncharacterized protein n=1 Tax=Trichinella pseudospiralis TaxID=6337 RepID=A0A0V1HA80_TRIPS|nr:hypothetical protein T4A_8734 [Trichinella pseudospiralis]KRZ07710.1 hypothetical protein T4B_5383 [Trichinella pseudospiralis]KRZ24370.1 hypothetical protein T4C_7386 [Trichinella pseudospiralis]